MAVCGSAVRRLALLTIDEINAPAIACGECRVVASRADNQKSDVDDRMVFTILPIETVKMVIAFRQNGWSEQE